MLNPYESPQSEEPKKPFDVQEWIIDLIRLAAEMLVVLGFLFMILLQVITFADANGYKYFMQISTGMIAVGVLMYAIMIYLNIKKNGRN